MHVICPQIVPEALGGVCHRALELIRNEYEAPTWQAFWQVVGEGRKPGEVAVDLGLSLGPGWGLRNL